MTLTEHVAMVTSGARGRMMLSERAPSPVHQRISCIECAMVLGHTLRRLYDSTSWSVDVVASSSTGLGWRSRCSSELLLSLRKPFRPVAGVHTAKTWSRSARFDHLRPPRVEVSLFLQSCQLHWHIGVACTSAVASLRFCCLRATARVVRGRCSFWACSSSSLIFMDC